ncbi:MAG: NAD(P)H-dependent oxidoreductase [Bacteroidetes bacterium]|nr:NAD(P)H-dependent oxidoreductase [Bacteroidota bacterium]
MKILAFAATNSKNSINSQLVQFASTKFTNATVEFADLNHYEMPIFSIDREIENGIPQLALDFAEKIDRADLILISFAEHNGTYTVAFKNIFDWISRIPGRKAFGEKSIFAMATSTGIRGGKGVLETAIKRFPFNGGNIIADFSLPKFNDNFSIENGITNNEILEEFNLKIEEIKQHFEATPKLILENK